MKKSSSLPNITSSSIIINDPSIHSGNTASDLRQMKPSRLLSLLPSKTLASPQNPIKIHPLKQLDSKNLHESELINDPLSGLENSVEYKSSVNRSKPAQNRTNVSQSSTTAGVEELAFRKNFYSFDIMESEKNEKMQKILLLNEVCEGKSFVQNRVLLFAVVLAFVAGLYQMFGVALLSGARTSKTLVINNAEIDTHASGKHAVELDTFSEKLALASGHFGHNLETDSNYQDTSAKKSDFIKNFSSHSTACLLCFAFGTGMSLLILSVLSNSSLKTQIQFACATLLCTLVLCLLSQILNFWAAFMATILNFCSTVSLLLLSSSFLKAISSELYFSRNFKLIPICYLFGTMSYVAQTLLFGNSQGCLVLALVPLFLSTILPSTIPQELNLPQLHDYYFNFSAQNQMPLKKSQLSHLLNLSHVETIKLRVHLQTKELDMFDFLKLFSFISSECSDSTIDSLSASSYKLSVSGSISLDNSPSTANSYLDSFNSFGPLGKDVISDQVPVLTPILNNFSKKKSPLQSSTISEKTHTSLINLKENEDLNLSVRSLPDINLGDDLSTKKNQIAPSMPDMMEVTLNNDPTEIQQYNQPLIKIVFHKNNKLENNDSAHVSIWKKIYLIFSLTRVQHKFIYSCHFVCILIIGFLTIFSIVLQPSQLFGLTFHRELIFKLVLITIMLLFSDVIGAILTPSTWSVIQMTIFSISVALLLSISSSLENCVTFESLGQVTAMLTLGAILSFSEPDFVPKITRPKFSSQWASVVVLIASIISGFCLLFTWDSKIAQKSIILFFSVSHLFGYLLNITLYRK